MNEFDESGAQPKAIATRLKFEESIETSTVPHWLAPKKRHFGPPYTEHDLEIIFERMMAGERPKIFLSEDPTLPSFQTFIKLVFADPKLLRRYREAQKVSAETWFDEYISAAEGKNKDGEQLLETEARSALRMKAYEKIIETYNRDVYGSKTQVDVNTKLDLGEAMAEAMRRREALLIKRDEKVIDHGE